MPALQIKPLTYEWKSGKLKLYLGAVSCTTCSTSLRRTGCVRTRDGRSKSWKEQQRKRTLYIPLFPAVQLQSASAANVSKRLFDPFGLGIHLSLCFKESKGFLCVKRADLKKTNSNGLQ